MDTLNFQEEKLRIIAWLSSLQDQDVVRRLSELMEQLQGHEEVEDGFSMADRKHIDRHLERSLSPIEESEYLGRKDLEHFFDEWRSELSE